MSKNSKKRERELKIAKRKAMKKANMASQDNYRLKKHNKKKKRKSSSHSEGHCGNIGCNRCNPKGLRSAKNWLKEKVIAKSGKEKYLQRINRNK